MTQTTSTDHSHARLIASCEALCHDLEVSDEGFREVIARHLQPLAARVSDGFRSIVTWDHSRPEVMNANTTARFMRTLTYTDITGIMVDKPVGFTGHLSDHVEWLRNTVMPTMERIPTEVIKPMIATLSGYINDADSLNEPARPEEGIALDQELRERINTEFGAYRVEGNRSTEAEFGSLYWSCRDFTDTLTSINAVNTVRWDKLQPRQIAKEVLALQELAETLLRSIDSKTPIHQTTMGHLGSELKQAALWIEWYGLMTAHIIDVTAALKRTEQRMLKI